jgi:hypothetical protein
MKQILAVFSVIFSLFFLNACDDEKSNAILESKVIRFQVEIPAHESEAGTRVDVNALKFEHGDEIGLFVVRRDNTSSSPIQEKDNYADNVKMTYDSYTNTWVVDRPIYYFPFDKSQNIKFDFYAYYPYIRGVNPTDMKIWGVLDSQESSINLGRSDFMTACQIGYVVGSDEFVKLHFMHHFSLVRLDYQTKDSQPLPFIGIRAGQYVVNAFRLDDVAKEEASLTCGKVSNDMLTGMSPLNNSGISGITTYQAIVIPQYLDDNPLFYTLKNKELSSINAENIPIRFEKGKAYRFSPIVD